MNVPIQRLRRAIQVAVACAPVLLLSTACASSGNKEWVEADISIPSERVLRQVATRAMEKNGFPSGQEDGNAQSTVSSGWNVQLQPFKGDGTRSRAHLTYEETGAGVFHVAIRVEKERNDELAKPLELAAADWTVGPDDQEMASRILRYIQTMIGKEFQLSPREAPPVPDDRRTGTPPAGG